MGETTDRSRARSLSNAEIATPEARPATAVVAFDAEAGGVAEIASALECKGITFAAAREVTWATMLVEQHRPKVLVLGAATLEAAPLALVTRARELVPGLQVVVLSSQAQAPPEAPLASDYDVLLRPVSRCRVGATVHAALARAGSGPADPRALAARRHAKPSLERGRWACLVGRSSRMQRVFREIQEVADTSMTVLIVGETGTGKELVARAIHDLSSRRASPLGVIDCGAMPETLFESELFGHEKGAFSGADRSHRGQIELAEGGTFFLDEIGNMPLPLQAKLLRVLEDHKVRPLGAAHARAIDVRFVAATNVPLGPAATRGMFRPDLLYRVAEFTIELPPLRDRGDDVLLLADQFLHDANSELGCSVPGLAESAKAALLAHAWPGNARELRNVIRRAVIAKKSRELDRATLLPLISLPPELQPDDATPLIESGRSLRELVALASEAVERRAITEALALSRNNKALAARMLHVDYKTLFIKLKRYGLYGHDI